MGEFSTDSAETKRQEKSDFFTSVVHVDGVGEYDLGKEWKLGIEKNPGGLGYGSMIPRP